MYDKELVPEVLSQIDTAAQRIARRFQNVNAAEDFVSSDEGLDKLDGICMQLIVIGESLEKPGSHHESSSSCALSPHRLEKRQRDAGCHHPPLCRSERAGGF
jgi:hypothetical protein